MARARPLVLCLLVAGLARADEPSQSLEFLHDDCVMGVAYARAAFAATWAFVGAGDRAVAFLAARPGLAPWVAAPPGVIVALVRDLDGPAPLRDRALRRLRRQGLAAKPALIAATRENDSPEVRRGAARLLEQLSPLGLARDLKPRVAREAHFALQRVSEG